MHYSNIVNIKQGVDIVSNSPLNSAISGDLSKSEVCAPPNGIFVE